MLSALQWDLIGRRYNFNPLHFLNFLTSEARSCGSTMRSRENYGEISYAEIPMDLNLYIGTIILRLFLEIWSEHVMYNLETGETRMWIYHTQKIISFDETYLFSISSNRGIDVKGIIWTANITPQQLFALLNGGRKAWTESP